MTIRHTSALLAVALAATLLAAAAAPAQAQTRTFSEGSLIIPMDLAYQDSGIFQAYGLLFHLLREGVPVYWVIDQEKTWHDAPCDTLGDECMWDCAVEGSGIKCSYPTASPDFFADARVLWDDQGVASPGEAIGVHGYRAGPFVIDVADRERAIPVIDAWNDPALWADAPWAARTEFNVVTVHEAAGDFTGYVRKEMVAAPTIAVFSDGNEDIATEYLRSAGIPQSNGNEFPANKCGDGDCGPGTDNPDMLTVPSIMGDMGTCDAINYDHENGALFTEEGVPAYCQIMSMHWAVNDRETVECDGGGCPATEAECNGETFTYHGHEVVAEVRQFLQYPVHFFAECQAVNAYENTVPNPAWPYLDDDGRRGHFLTTEGTPPSCPCTDGDFECVPAGCDGGARDCCLPRDVKEQGAGFLVAAQPDANTLQIFHPEVAYNQLDGFFGTIGGSEPAYNLSSYLGTQYINDREVTFITGPNGPGDQDVWMTGFTDGECEITGSDDVGGGTGECNIGKVSYLGGHDYANNTPLSGNDNSQGGRLFLNALFEADCVTSVGQPSIALSLDGGLVIGAHDLPVEREFTASFLNQGLGIALDAVLTEIVADGVEVTAIDDGGAMVGADVQWTIGAISADPVQVGDPPHQGGRQSTLQFADYGEYEIQLQLSYRVGLSQREASPQTFIVRVAPDADGDGVPDDLDPAPNDPRSCGDSDGDTCDDCSVTGMQTPLDDGPDADGDGTCDAGEDPGLDGDGGGCGCRASAPADLGAWLLLLAVFGLCLPRRRKRSRSS